MPISAITVTKRSDIFPALTAVYSPSATPTTNQMIAAPMASANVRGTPRRISSLTLTWFVYESRSPLKSFCIVLRVLDEDVLVEAPLLADLPRRPAA